MEAEKIQSVTEGKYLRLVVELEPSLREVLRYGLPCGPEGVFAFVDDVEVVHVSPVVAEAEALFHEVVELVEV